jgi:hypothetical protein
MDKFMLDNKYTQVPELDGDSSLYDQKFLEPFSFVIPPSVLITPDAVAMPQNNSKAILIVLAVVVVALLIFFLH